METEMPAGPTRPLPIVAGNLALDFANTVDDPGGVAHFDHIHDLAGLLAWSERRGVLPAGDHRELLALAERNPDRANAGLRTAHRLREFIQSAFGAVASDRPVPETAWRGIRVSAAAAVAHSRLVVDADRVHLGWDFTTPDAVTWPVAYAAHDLLTGRLLSRVKQCAGCPWLYLDQSKNSSRRWCSMDDCGRHEKIVRYVERRAARRMSSRAEDRRINQ
jgi:predicted RNA-binding Zn ribbon-like protein